MVQVAEKTGYILGRSTGWQESAIAHDRVIVNLAVGASASRERLRAVL